MPIIPDDKQINVEVRIIDICPKPLNVAHTLHIRPVGKNNIYYLTKNLFS